MKRIIKINKSATGRKMLLAFLIVLSPLFVNGQKLTLTNSQQKARTNYPQVKQYGLIEQTAQFNLSNANKGYLPQLTLTAKGTYQSEVTKVPISMPGISISEMSKDQYQAVLEANQVLWDGGTISAQKKATTANAEVEKQKLEVDLYTLDERVNQAYFGTLLINEQIGQNTILQNELNTNLNRIGAMQKNGVATQADLDAIQVELLNAKQRETELRSAKKAYLIVLGALTGTTIDEKAELEKPLYDRSSIKSDENHRPELALFDAQNKMFETQKLAINAANMPKIGLFAQAGYGRPGLNMLSNNFNDFYIGGVRISWNISNFYTQKNNLKKIELSKKNTDVQRETFLFNNNLKTQQQLTELDKLEQLVRSDDEIIRLRLNIKKSTSSKLDNGTSTVNDLIRETNAENQARQQKALHEVQLLMAAYQIKNNLNN